MSQIKCDGPECPICKLLGPPTVVQIPVKDLNDGGKVKMMTLNRAKAIELGMLKDEPSA